MADLNVVIIPARGGSKRFSRKNIANLAGRPLISYAIQAANAASTINATYVSTDDEEIADIARKYGAEVPYMRPVELAGDNIPADEAVKHMLRHLIDNEGASIGNVVLIQPTSPFIRAAHIDAAIDLLNKEQNLQSVTSMSQLDHRHHPYNLSFPAADGTWDFCFTTERAASLTRQSKPVAQKFCNLFASRSQSFLSHGRFGEVKGSIELDPLYAWDIDYEWELAVAETLIEKGYVDLDA